MQKFVALIYGVGEGCDYTIGCNRTFEVGGAETAEDFVNSILEEHGQKDYDTDFPEPRIRKIEVLAVAGQETIFDNLDQEYIKECKNHQKLKDNADYKKYLELHERFKDIRK